MTLRREHPDDILAVRRARYNIPIRQFRIEHCESVVMLGGDGDVLHARGLRQCDPRRRVELERIEKRWALGVIGSVDWPRLHDPFSVAPHAGYAPVYEQSELVLLEPSTRSRVRCRGPVILLRSCTR